VEYRYDAFISYRHGDLDSKVAERLHKLLEAYRIPSALAKKLGKKKLDRIFRDREELPTSSDLSKSINEALETSRFLILICSRRTCASQWVMREVERFGELHGKDKIVALLIDGEPDESFPPGLREREIDGEIVLIEPLAADIRAETHAKSLKLLNEEKLRLLSPILGCRFDDLRQRHRRRKMQRIAAVSATAFAMVTAFALYATSQYLQIRAQMQMKLENQSYVLAEYATDRVNDGDPDTALLLALEALPKNLTNPERPYVPAAERALADALRVYAGGSGYEPIKAFTLPSPAEKLLLSPDERYAAVLCAYQVVVADVATGQTLATLPAQSSVLNDIAFLDATTLVYTGESGLATYDIATGTELWLSNPASLLSVSGDGKVIAAVYRDTPSAFLVTRDGAMLGELDFGGRRMSVLVDGALFNPRTSLLSLNSDGTALAVSFNDGSVCVFSAAGEVELMAPSDAALINGGFFENTLAVAATKSAGVDSWSTYMLYNQVTGKVLNTYDITGAGNYFAPILSPYGHLLTVGGELLTIDLHTGSGTRITNVGERIEAVDQLGNTYLIATESGQYHFADTLDAKVDTYQSDYVNSFVDIGAEYALTASRSSTTVRILRYADNSARELFTYDAGYSFSEARVQGELDRAVFYSFRGLRLCNLRGEIIADAEFPDSLLVKDTQYDLASGNVIVIYDDALLIYSGTDGRLLVDTKAKSVIYTPFGVGTLNLNGGATLWDASTGEGTPMQPEDDAARALPTSVGLLTVRGGNVYYDGNLLGEGDIVGAGLGEGEVFVAISNGADGKVFALTSGKSRELFDFKTVGRTEVYFTGGCVFVSPAIGDASVYTQRGDFVRTLAENASLTETVMLGDTICANYLIPSSKQRYSLLLDKERLEPVALIHEFLGAAADGRLVLNNGEALESVELLDTAQLIALATERLNGKQLTSDEKQRYKAW